MSPSKPMEGYCAHNERVLHNLTKFVRLVSLSHSVEGLSDICITVWQQKPLLLVWILPPTNFSPF